MLTRGVDDATATLMEKRTIEQIEVALDAVSKDLGRHASRSSLTRAHACSGTPPGRTRAVEPVCACAGPLDKAG